MRCAGGWVVPVDHSQQERWVGVDDVALHLGVRKDSVYRWIEAKGLPARKIGKLWKLKLSQVDAWVEARGAGESHGLELARPGVAAPVSARAAGRQRAAILVVDDDELVCAALRTFLADEGYESMAAGDGEQALRLLQGCAPDLILLDLGMPVMDGRRFREEQLRDEQLARIPVIVLSAERFADVPGVAAVLRKPLDLQQLSTAIARVLFLRSA